MTKTAGIIIAAILVAMIILILIAVRVATRTKRKNLNHHQPTPPSPPSKGRLERGWEWVNGRWKKATGSTPSYFTDNWRWWIKLIIALGLIESAWLYVMPEVYASWWAYQRSWRFFHLAFALFLLVPPLMPKEALKGKVRTAFYVLFGIMMLAGLEMNLDEFHDPTKPTTMSSVSRDGVMVNQPRSSTTAKASHRLFTLHYKDKMYPIDGNPFGQSGKVTFSCPMPGGWTAKYSGTYYSHCTIEGWDKPFTDTYSGTWTNGEISLPFWLSATSETTTDGKQQYHGWLWDPRTSEPEEDQKGRELLLIER